MQAQDGRGRGQAKRKMAANQPEEREVVLLIMQPNLLLPMQPILPTQPIAAPTTKLAAKVAASNPAAPKTAPAA